MDKRPPLNYTPPHFNYPPPYGTPPHAQFYQYNFPPLRAPRLHPVPPGRPWYEFHHSHCYPSPCVDAEPSRSPMYQQYPFWQLYKPAPTSSNVSAGYIEYPAGPSQPDTYQPIPLPSDVKKKKEIESKTSAVTTYYVDPDLYKKIQESAKLMVLTPKQNEDLVNFHKLMCQPHLDPMEVYTRLPSSFFPRAKSLNLDANGIIDEFCSSDTNIDYEWILDIEFGINHSRKRQIAIKHSKKFTMPIFDVKRQSIQCHDAVDRVYPGFHKCSERFKSKMMGYYGLVISYWYKGYIITAQDDSFENFQAWLSTAMLTYGMCWP